MDADIFIPVIIFGSALAVILMPIYWRMQMRHRVLEAVRDMAQKAAPHDVPFLRAFFEKAFGLATARAAAQKGA